MKLRLAWCSLQVITLAVLLAQAAEGQHPERTDSPFSDRELVVRSSPEQPSEVRIPAGETVVDFDVWSTGAEAAVALRGSDGRYRVAFWLPPATEMQPGFALPSDFEPRSLACHPSSRSIFVSGRQGQRFAILRFDERADRWTPQTIYTTNRQLRRLLIAPRPFVVSPDASLQGSHQAYRLFFGAKTADGQYSLRSVTEAGKVEYQVLGPESSYVRVEGDESEQPAKNFVPSALPATFHPAGHILVWQDARQCFHRVEYESRNWGIPRPLWNGNLCQGSLTVTPNGMGLMQWKPQIAGVTVYLDEGKTELRQATEYTFISTPSSVPDGQGVIGLIQKEGGTALVYAPIKVPLADVMNAWMFTETADGRMLLTQHSGLLRQLGYDELYQLYDSEAYECGGYTHMVPTRPYLVTTDIFWENFAAAYEGTFIVQERQRAIPAFWEFVTAARASLPAQSQWAAVFSLLSQLRNPGAEGNPELRRIAQAAGREVSPITGQLLDYTDLKPRGHYASSPEMSAYFRAFRYLTLVSAPAQLDPTPLAALPDGTRQKALDWIRAYENYIAAARSPLLWNPKFQPPAYMRHPGENPSAFPLSWGFDNEVLLSTVFHPEWPASQQISGPGGVRAIPSGLDVAAALGSQFARALLHDEIAKYPPLVNALEDLAARRPEAGKNLYDLWIHALGVQWADDAAFPGVADEHLWRAKRLQSGLASWATLRHATVLVNERAAAECGEGGFEEIVLRSPRGYVEPDSKTFAAIADLFAALARTVQASDDFRNGALPAENDKSEPLRQGILRRLAEAEKKARLFQAIAEKELRHQELTADEYDEILYVGRVAEHQFLVFKSLANKDLALSDPDPMSKIADVAGGGNIPVLEAAVGRPMEWDQIVPFFGRSEVVKGSIYSYYEFTSPAPLNDTEWRQRVASQSHPLWIKPYVSPVNLSCPAKPPF